MLSLIMFNQKFERYLIKYCLCTRFIYTAISCLSRYFLPHHDPKVFISPVALLSVESSILDRIVLFILGGLTNWDAQHFYHISQSNYIYEHSLAFFPLYPIILRTLSLILSNISFNYLNIYSCLVLASYLFNLICFALSTIVLLRLSKIILKNDVMAFKASLLFIVSPSTIFFLASYSETLFSLLVFTGMLKYTKGQLFQSAIFFLLATATRSNGILNAGYILHFFLYTILINKFFNVYFFINIFKTIIYVLIVISPYLLFQCYSYYLYCVNNNFIEIPYNLINFGIVKQFKMPSSNISWCQDMIPLSYSYVQHHYWNVGFLKYYTFRQIPNFLLALPVILMIIPYSFYFLKYYRHLFLHLRLIYNPNLKYFVKPTKYSKYLLPRSTFVFNVHAFFLCLFCLLNINVQVTTRILCCSNPLVYWIGCMYFKKPLMVHKLDKSLLNMSVLGLEPNCALGYYIRFYYLSYLLIGIIMFSCDFPWT